MSDGGETLHPTLTRRHSAASPAIDYASVPAAWTSRLRSADVVDGRAWRTRSDHSPVVVEWSDPRDYSLSSARAMTRPK
jgi:endonuclease/exonuclease/phosphatase family metal-dependent hydrolase